MIHISSEDLVSGNTYEGEWEMNKPLLGSYKINYHFIDNQDVPWTYPGCNSLRVQEVSSGNVEFVNFGTIDVVGAPAAVLMQTAMRTVSFLPSVTVNTDPVGFIMENFDVDCNILWSNSSSNIKRVFSEKVIDEFVTAAPPGNILLQDTFVDLRPNLLEIHFDQTSSVTITSTLKNKGDLFIPMDDFIIKGSVVNFDKQTDKLSISWRRTNISTFSCPMPNRWEIVLI